MPDADCTNLRNALNDFEITDFDWHPYLQRWVNNGIVTGAEVERFMRIMEALPNSKKSEEEDLKSQLDALENRCKDLRSTANKAEERANREIKLRLDYADHLSEVRKELERAHDEIRRLNQQPPDEDSPNNEDSAE